ncbi:hypothetical protein, partial [Bartonella sp. CL34QHWL]|uniref:hypothetical protein n=1 Tax=Bartonella sp. CL34QHWL TaxID=3243526 RepID=UPI0035D0CFBD
MPSQSPPSTSDHNTTKNDVASNATDTSYFKIFLPLRYPKVRSHKAPVNLTSKATFPTPSLLSGQHTRLFIPT